MENEEQTETTAPEPVNTDDMTTDERDAVIDALEEELDEN